MVPSHSHYPVATWKANHETKVTQCAVLLTVPVARSLCAVKLWGMLICWRYLSHLPWHDARGFGSVGEPESSVGGEV